MTQGGSSGQGTVAGTGRTESPWVMPYDMETHSFRMDWQYPPAYERGFFYVGEAEGMVFGVPVTKHQMVIGGSQTGKGACFLIPNLLRWPENVFCIDPKGENTNATWKARVAMGKRVRVFDPFGVTDVPEELRASYNPMDEITDPFWEEVMILADALIKVHDPKHGHWDSGSKTILAGLIADAFDKLDLGDRTLPMVRKRLLLALKNPKAAVNGLREVRGFSGLPRAAAEALARKGNEGAHFISGAMENTLWMDSDSLSGVMESSDFRMADLKNSDTDVFLVLPPEYIGLHHMWLRLFVRLAMNAMAKGLGGRKVLFLLDEVHKLGYVPEFEETAGLMAGYGVHMVLFTQNLGQIVKIYGKEGAETFVGNSDSITVFGLMENETAEYVSRWIGPITHDDLRIPVPRHLIPDEFPLYYNTSPRPLIKDMGFIESFFGTVDTFEKEKRQITYQKSTIEAENEERRRKFLYEYQKVIYEEGLRRIRITNENDKAVLQHAVGMVGKPRISAYDVRVGTSRRQGERVAQAALVLTAEGVRITKPKGWFQ